MQTTTCTCSIDTVRAKLVELEKAAEEQRKRDDEAIAWKQAESVEIHVQEIPATGMSDLFDTTEVFEMRISLKGECGKLLCGSNGGSIGYFISRQHKKIIGTNGGGYCWLNIGRHSQWMSSSDDKKPTPYNTLRNRIQQAASEWIAALP